MRKLGRRVTWVGFVAGLALFVGVNTASAGVVSFGQGCYQGTGARTSAGPFQFRYGWGVYDPTKLTKFLGVQYMSYSLSVNGTSVGSWTTPVGYVGPGTYGVWENLGQMTNPQTGAVFFQARFTSQVLATLNSGDSAVLNFTLFTTKKVYDDSAQKIAYGPGAIFSVSCNIGVS
jgi:hypothetical protein